MSTYHVMDADRSGDPLIVMHLAVPAGNNSVGVPWRTLVVNLKENTTSMTIGDGPCQITQAEANLIATGEVWEASQRYTLSSAGPTIQEKAAALAAFVADRQELALARMATRLQYTGYTGA